MGTDALFGRYWPADSVLHRLDPRTKLAGTFALVVIMFIAGNFAALGVVAAFVIALFAIACIPPGQALRSIAPLVFIVVLSALFNVFFVQGGEVLVDWGWLAISTEGAYLAAFVALRLTLLLLAGSLLTLTTTTIDISEAFESLLSPLRRFGVPAHEFGMVLGIALRFLPQFVDEFRTIRSAQLMRGAKLATSPTKNGLAGITSLMVPLFTSAFRHAETLSSAMDARCYHGAYGRTRLHPLQFASSDVAFGVALLVLLVAVLAITLLA